MDGTHARFSDWESFYVIVGTSGGALIAIQFVVATLIGGLRRRPPAESLNAFGTPTLVELAAALFVSAIMSVPWPALWPAGLVLIATGVAGIVYCGVVLGRARHQTFYEPEWQDWVFYFALPCCAYAVLAIAGVLLETTTQTGLFLTGGAALGLLFIGIHNAWDSVAHLVLNADERDSAEKD